MNKNINSDGMKRLQKALKSAILKEYAGKKLEETGLNPKYLEVAADLVNNPDVIQTLYGETLEEIKIEDTHKRLRKVMYEKAVAEAKCNKNSELLHQAYKIIDAMVHLDIHDERFIEELKATQNLASMYMGQYGYTKDEEEQFEMVQ